MSNNIIQQEEYDVLMQGIVDNLEGFIDSINCIKETYEFSENTLKAHQIETTNKYDDFVKDFETKTDDGHTVFKVPSDRYREFQRVAKKKAARNALLN